MSEQNHQFVLRSQLGAKLRRMRQQTGLTVEQAASKLDETQRSLRRRESRVTKIDVHLARSMMDLYEIRDTDFLDEVRNAR